MATDAWSTSGKESREDLINEEDDKQSCAEQLPINTSSMTLQ